MASPFDAPDDGFDETSYLTARLHSGLLVREARLSRSDSGNSSGRLVLSRSLSRSLSHETRAEPSARNPPVDVVDDPPPSPQIDRRPPLVKTSADLATILEGKQLVSERQRCGFLYNALLTVLSRILTTARPGQ